MRRRDLVLLAASAAALRPWSVVAQPGATPVIGFLNSASPETFAPYVVAIHRGLKEAGYTEGQNMAVEYRWARGRYELLPALATDLVAQRVSVLVATGGEPSALAAKAATTTIPIVFSAGSDAVKLGLVASLSRPGGNATGVILLSTELEAKRFELLAELLPHGRTVGILVNPNLAGAERQASAVLEAAQPKGWRVVVLNASTEEGIDRAFTTLADEGADGLIVGSDPFFNSRRERLVAVARRYRMPAIYEWREFVQVGGLISYGTSLTGAYRQFGLYTGRILSGAKPAELPVHQPTQFEIVVNLRTAAELSLTLSPFLSARVDEVIE
jgi:putative ABC transport system substrate-binding protein